VTYHLTDPLLLTGVLLLLLWLRQGLRDRRRRHVGLRARTATITNPSNMLEFRMVNAGLHEVEVLEFVNDDCTHYRVRDQSGAIWWVQVGSLTFNEE